MAIAALLAVQAAALAIYRAVERKRSSAANALFRVEELGGHAPAPDIVLERADGTRLSVHTLTGRVRLVHFWATWCAPCVDELPGLLATSRELAERGLTLMAISMDDDWDAIRAFFGDDMPAEIYRAEDHRAHERYEVFSLPDTYLVTRDDRLLLRYGGARNWQGSVARKHLTRLLR